MLLAVGLLLLPLAAAHRVIVTEMMPLTASLSPTRDEAQRVTALNAERAVLLVHQQPASALAVVGEDALYGPDVRAGFQDAYGISLAVGDWPCSGSAGAGAAAAALACAALARNMTLVANMAVADAANSSRVYNTDVVFGPDGRVDGLYRKHNLYFEPEWTAGPGDVVTVDAAGRRWAVFTCFDVMNPVPQTRWPRVDGVIFPTWWVNIPPAITARGVQHAFAAFHNTTLLAAGAGYNWQTSGSGIYRGVDVLDSYFNPTAQSNSLALSVDLDAANASRASAPLPAQQRAARTHVRKAQRARPAADARQVDSSIFDATVTTFTPVVDGQSHVVKATRDELACSVTYTAASAAGNQTYGVMAMTRLYYTTVPVRYCSLVACPLDYGKSPSATCLDAHLNATVAFSNVRVDGTLEWPGQARGTFYPLITGDQGALVPLSAAGVTVDEDWAGVGVKSSGGMRLGGVGVLSLNFTAHFGDR